MLVGAGRRSRRTAANAPDDDDGINESTENATWDVVRQKAHSNAELLSLLEDPPVGVLPLLDDQAALPSPSDGAFCATALQVHATSPGPHRPMAAYRADVALGALQAHARMWGPHRPRDPTALS